MPSPECFPLVPDDRRQDHAHCLWLSWILLHLREQHSLLLLQCAPFLSQQRPFLQRRPGLQGQLPLHGLFAFPV